MTIWEITFNVTAAGTTIVLLVFARHLLKTCGRGRLNDPELVKQFRDTAPYDNLEDLLSNKE